VTVLGTKAENTATSTIIPRRNPRGPSRLRRASQLPALCITPVADSPSVIARSVKMKMTVSLENPAKASAGVSAPVSASRQTMTSAVTSRGIASMEKRTMPMSTMASTRAIPVMSKRSWRTCAPSPHAGSAYRWVMAPRTCRRLSAAGSS